MSKKKKSLLHCRRKLSTEHKEVLIDFSSVTSKILQSTLLKNFVTQPKTTHKSTLWHHS